MPAAASLRTGVSQLFVVVNDGNAPSERVTVALTGMGREFLAIGYDSCTGAFIPPVPGSCTVEVVKLESLGFSVSATLIVSAGPELVMPHG